MKKRSDIKNKRWLWRLIPAILAAAVLLGCRPAEPAPTETEPAPTITVREDENIDLGQGLVIERVDRYSGIYMEDGSNDTVQDVMMLLVRNDSERDLQLARIDVTCGGETAGFEVTDLPAGARAVVLERSRRTYAGERVDAAEARNVAFFDSAMSLKPEMLELHGEAGRITVTNRSDTVLPGPICVYYKNSAADLYYGGITYRVTISQSLAAGETVTIPAGHYDPEGCRFVRVDCGG